MPVFSGDLGAHRWVVRFWQPPVQSPSWSWLPIGEARDVSRTQPFFLLYTVDIFNNYSFYIQQAREENLDRSQTRTRGGRGRGKGVRNRLQSTPQHFRNVRSPTDGENSVPDWLIKCQLKIRLSVKIYCSLS